MGRNEGTTRPTLPRPGDRPARIDGDATAGPANPYARTKAVREQVSAERGVTVRELPAAFNTVVTAPSTPSTFCADRATAQAAVRSS
ncbi:hypothetical protein [Streptomyces sp. NPDC058475]|uniref:hypothetical protein n=1 Tax=unclassified Streptomyces TaxID=2593676 RepID=UPI003648B52A